ncbi:hypothetical protein V494_05800 [Pseudogymnoascus sp. VKM F-4513 (FW-928)]|nr:hypothetical protein V494_05800 [Pseudogymnoascus sp. VKM F-4513 (FW-928)]
MDNYGMSCDICAGIALRSGISLTEKQERSIAVNCDSVQKSAENGCLSCRLIQGIAQAGSPKESNVTSILVQIDKDGYLYLFITYIVTGASFGVIGWLYPFTVQETPWELIPIDKFTDPDPPTFESALPLIQTWIQRCDLDHSCVNHGLGIPTKLPTRVIDVGDSCHDPYLYHTNGETGRYAALSHCWGPPEMSCRRLATIQANLSEHCDGIALDEFPKTFRDAINITRGLGLRYLWIDSLCIIQDSCEDWILEVSRMADIFLNSYITLAADLSPNSDAGLFITDTCLTNSAPQVRQFSQVDHTGTDQQIFVRVDWPKPGKNRDREDVENRLSCYVSEATSKMDSRAWVLQESILSARTVHFTNAELRFPGDNGEEPSNLEPTIWHSIVNDFAARDLTYAKDRLPAISSLARMMPFPANDYLAGLWQNSLMDDLIWLNPIGNVYWESDESSEFTRLYTLYSEKNYRIQGEYAPSWSWASILAPVAFRVENGMEGGIIPDWTVTGAKCTPITANPYGPVSKSSSLDVEGYLLPVTFENVTTRTSRAGKNDYTSTELCVVRGDKAFPGKNSIWFDAGIGSNEWQVEGSSYYALVIGCQAVNKTPVALVLRDRESVDGDGYTRIGLVSLDNWKGHEWNVGAQRRAITIF